MEVDLRTTADTVQDFHFESEKANDFVHNKINRSVQQLGNIVRYSNKFRIHDENVAEHSFYVSYYVIQICNEFNIDSYNRLKALEFSIIHDIPESKTGDVVLDSKTSKMSTALSELEINRMKQHYSSKDYALYSEYYLAENARTLPYIVSKLADVLSVVEYSKIETELGNNTDEMILIKNDSQLRAISLYNELESFLKNS